MRLFTYSLLLLQTQAPADRSSAVAKNPWHRIAVSESDPGRPIENSEIVIARGKYFDEAIGAEHRLDVPKEARLNNGGFAVDHFPTPDPLPLKASDLVATAEFADYWPVLSQSGRSLYTITRFRLDRVITSQPPHTVSDFIEILFPGGTLKRDDGSTISYGLHAGDDLPIDLKQRYLLFLTYDKTLDAYSVVKHWELEHGVVVAVDLLESQRNRMDTVGIHGMPESILVNKLLELSH